MYDGDDEFVKSEFGLSALIRSASNLLAEEGCSISIGVDDMNVDVGEVVLVRDNVGEFVTAGVGSNDGPAVGEVTGLSSRISTVPVPNATTATTAATAPVSSTRLATVKIQATRTFFILLVVVFGRSKFIVVLLSCKFCVLTRLDRKSESL